MMEKTMVSVLGERGGVFMVVSDDKGGCMAADFGGGAVYGKAW